MLPPAWPNPAVRCYRGSITPGQGRTMRGLGFMGMTVALCLAVALAAPAAAQGIGPTPHVSIHLLAETNTPAPNSEVTLALVSASAPGWHAYWQNPGDAGLPRKGNWAVPYPVTPG